MRLNMSIGVYACDLEHLGLPTNGLSKNGQTLTNHWARVNYIQSLPTDEARAVFINHLLEAAYHAGVDAGQESMIDEDED